MKRKIFLVILVLIITIINLMLFKKVNHNKFSNSETGSYNSVEK